MPFPTPDIVRNSLNGFELQIRSILEEAWKEWMATPSRGRFSARSRASMVFDFVRTRAISEFDDDPNIHVITKGQTVQFLFRDKVLVRFKKANGKGLGSNIQTQEVLNFIDQQAEIPGLLPDVFRVEICYHLDELATEMELIAVTARQMNRKLWAYELERPASAEVKPFPTPPDAPIDPTEVRVRIKKPDAQPGE